MEDVEAPRVSPGALCVLELCSSMGTLQLMGQGSKMTGRSKAGQEGQPAAPGGRDPQGGTQVSIQGSDTNLLVFQSANH